MAINVKGGTDVTGAASIMNGSGKTVTILAKKGSGTPTLAINTPVNITGTKSAMLYFGGNQDVIDMVTMLIKNDVKSIHAVLVAEADGTIITEAKAYGDALSSLMGDPKSKILLFDEISVDVVTELKKHLDLAEQEQIFRYGVLGVSSTMTTSIAMATFAETADNKRIFIAGPHLLNADGTDAKDIIAACGLASILATKTDDPALPACSCSVVGLGGVKENYLKSENDALVTAGITPFIMEDGRLITYKVVTSRTSADDGEAQVWNDGTTILIADYLFESVRTRIRANYPRAKNVPRILDAIRGDVIDVLGNAQVLEIIENFDEKLVSVIKDPHDIFGAIMDYTFDVVTPLYTITLTQHMKL